MLASDSVQADIARDPSDRIQIVFALSDASRIPKPWLLGSLNISPKG
jgi:hypothetical protein